MKKNKQIQKRSIRSMLGLGACFAVASACGGSGGSGLDKSLVVSELTGDQSQALYSGVQSEVDDYVSAAHGLMCNMAGHTPVIDDLTQGDFDLSAIAELDGGAGLRDKAACETARDACLDKDLGTIMKNMAEALNEVLPGLGDEFEDEGLSLENEDATDEFKDLQKECEGVSVGDFEACFAELTAGIQEMADSTACGADFEDFSALNESAGDAQEMIIGEGGKDSVCEKIQKQCAVDTVLGGTGDLDDFSSEGFSSPSFTGSNAQTSDLQNGFGSFGDDLVDGGPGSINPALSGPTLPSNGGVDGNTASGDMQTCVDKYALDTEQGVAEFENSLAWWASNLDDTDFNGLDPDQIARRLIAVSAVDCEITTAYEEQVEATIAEFAKQDGVFDGSDQVSTGEPCSDAEVQEVVDFIGTTIDPTTSDSLGVPYYALVTEFNLDGKCQINDDVLDMINAKLAAIVDADSDAA